MHGFRKFLEAHPMSQQELMGVGDEPSDDLGDLSPQSQSAMSNPGKSAEINQKLDALQMSLDVAGLEPTIGTVADIANVAIYGGRAVAEPGQARSHLTNALISLVSVIPFADVVKLLKARGYRKLAKRAIQTSRGIKTGANLAKVQRSMGPSDTTFDAA